MPSPLVLGIDFGGSKVAAAVVDRDGNRLGTTRLAVRRDESAMQTFRRSIEMTRRLIAEVGGGGSLAAVGACTFGIPSEDGIALAPNIPGWESLAFGAQLQAAFPEAVVRTGSDVKAAAQGEAQDGALAGCDPALYVNLGTGLAVALVVGGRVVTGRHRASGEIGYNLRTPGGFDEARLEEVVSGKALETAAHQLLGAGVPELLDRAGHAGQAGHDPRAAAIRDRFVDELCLHLVNLTIALDPQRVAVGGGLVHSWEHFGPQLGAALAAAVPYPPELVVAAHPYDAPLIGALALGRSAARDAHALQDVVSEGAPA